MAYIGVHIFPLNQGTSQKKRRDVFMGSLVQVDKQEWDAFLEKLSELEKKYQVVLRELDTAHNRLRALDNSQEQQEKPIPTVSASASAKGSPKLMATKPKKPEFLTQLKTELQSLQIRLSSRADWGRLNPNAPPNYASCNRCGGKIMHATRFCERCGADFGKAVCSCGHELSSSHKFCDHCGRPVS